MVFIKVTFQGWPVNPRSRPLIGLMTSMVAGLGSLGPISMDLIFKRVRLTLELV